MNGVQESQDSQESDADADLDIEDDYDDWESEDDDKNSCQCLFCNEKGTIENTLNHMKEGHKFDLSKTIKELSLQSYDAIKLINYVRRHKVQSHEITGLKSSLWSEETYLRPVLADDPLIQYVISLDDFDEDIQNPAEASSSKLLEKERLELVESLRRRLADQDEVVSETPDNDDNSYFNSYGYLDIHETMLKDVQRTEAYRQFIESPVNAAIFKGKNILDVGCGTGILSMFAARAGARSVVGVDESSIVDIARKNIEENGFEERIRIVQGKIEQVDLPEKSFDVIISEWMGYNLLYESMLDSVLFAIKKFLSPGGLVVPSQCDMMLTLIQDDSLWQEKKSYWKNVYGFRMSAVEHLTSKEALIDFTRPENVIAKPVLLKHFHLPSLGDEIYLPFTTKFSLEINSGTKLHAFVTYFDSRFQADGRPVPHEAEISTTSWTDPQAVLLSTAPSNGVGTHWKQTILLLNEPVPVKKGQKVHGEIITMRHPEGRRLLVVEIHWHLDQGPLQYQTFTIE